MPCSQCQGLWNLISMELPQVLSLSTGRSLWQLVNPRRALKNPSQFIGGYLRLWWSIIILINVLSCRPRPLPPSFSLRDRQTLLLAKNQPKRITSIWFSPPPPKSTFYLASIGAIWFLINPSQFRNIRWLHSTANNSRMMMTKIIVISVSSSVRLSLLHWNGWNIIGGGIRLFFCSFSDLLPLLSVLRWYIKRNLNLVRGSTSSGRIMKWMRWDGMGRGNIEHL